MFRQAVHQWFWDFYDHFGRLLVANVLFFVVLGATAWMGLMAVSMATDPLGPAAQALGTYLFLLVAAPPWLAAWFAPFAHFGDLVHEQKDPPLRALLAGLRRDGMRAWKWFLALTFIGATLVLNSWFYLTAFDIGESLRPVAYGLGFLCLWLFALLAASTMIGTPLALRGGLGTRAALKASFVAMLRFPGLILGCFVFLCSLWVIGVATKLSGVILFGFCGTALLQNSVYDVLLEWEAARNEAKSGGGARSPRNWREVEELQAHNEERRQKRARYDRSLRDLLRPWEG